VKTKLQYRLPVDARSIRKVYFRKSAAHRIYKNAVDFIAPEGTPVKAAASGLVIDVRSGSGRSGSARHAEIWENFVEIRHISDEYSYYGHLRKERPLVAIGDSVRQGQVIGHVGRTGWLANVPEPHLHFMVGRYDYKTLEIRFKDKAGKTPRQ
jgi:murein DD-endopeptidase MepM/ murein hydrolase activator NlpD